MLWKEIKKSVIHTTPRSGSKEEEESKGESTNIYSQKQLFRCWIYQWQLRVGNLYHKDKNYISFLLLDYYCLPYLWLNPQRKTLPVWFCYVTMEMGQLVGLAQILVVAMAIDVGGGPFGNGWWSRRRIKERKHIQLISNKSTYIVSWFYAYQSIKRKKASLTKYIDEKCTNDTILHVFIPLMMSFCMCMCVQSTS